MSPITREQFGILVKPVRQRLRKELRFVPEEILDWRNRDFLIVTNKQGSEGVLIAPLDNGIVLPFAIERRKPNSRGRVEAIICDICATWQRGTHSAVITFWITSTHSVSFLCCGDLQCSLHVRGMTAASVLARAQVREQLSNDERVDRLNRRLKAIIDTITEQSAVA